MVIHRKEVHRQTYSYAVVFGVVDVVGVVNVVDVVDGVDDVGVVGVVDVVDVVDGACNRSSAWVNECALNQVKEKLFDCKKTTAVGAIT